MTVKTYAQLAKELMELEQVPSVSEHETEMGNAMKKKLAGMVDRTFFDDFKPAPNVLSEKKGTSGKYKLAVDYHIDQIGFEVRSVNAGGNIRIKRLGGGFEDRYVLGKEFDIQTPNGPVRAKARRVKGQYDYVLKIRDADSMKKVEELGVAPQQQAAYATKPVRMEGTYIVKGPAIDDRVGATEAIENAKHIKKVGGVKSDVLYVGSAQEETGLYGSIHVAKTSAKGCDVAIIVDDTFADSHAKQGAGPVLIVKDCFGKVDPKAQYLIEEAAKREGVKLQKQDLSFVGGTNAYAYTRVGIAGGALAVPVNYGHSDQETVDLRDVAGAVKVLNRVVTDAEEILDSYQRMTESKTYKPVALTDLIESPTVFLKRMTESKTYKPVAVNGLKR